MAEAPVPGICVLDPDGDILRVLRREERTSLSRSWACYHTGAGVKQEIIGKLLAVAT